MSSARVDRRERMALETRREILQAARQLFAEHGYAATSMNDIAEQAGVAGFHIEDTDMTGGKHFLRSDGTDLDVSRDRLRPPEEFAVSVQAALSSNDSMAIRIMDGLLGNFGTRQSPFSRLLYRCARSS